MTPRDRKTLEQLKAEIGRWELALADVLRSQDGDLVERAVRGAKLKGRPRWVAVKDVFAVGSTSAHRLCERFGLDPEEVTT